MLCPIIRKEIEEDECTVVTKESYHECKDKQADIPNKFKRIAGWRAICKQCKKHKKVQ
ncbi:hypothetical protein lbkm_2495 [Lachnospiraceae bacterium KM106-2]|nr:hypothetical protein lbkm_2495 [Lachnospiraceae bacterium KM106-2]